MNAIKILIVEDEVLLAQDIALRLNAINYEVIGIKTSVADALVFLEGDTIVDIILIDIALKGGQDGIALASVINKKYQIPFIFLTAHADERIVERAKKVNPYAYILKPFNDRQVSIAIELALLNLSKRTSHKDDLSDGEINESENQVLQIKNSLFLKKDHYFRRVLLSDILFIQADSNYSTIYTTSEKFVYAIVLKKIEIELPTDKFIRVHRSYIVNVDNISGYEGNLLFVKTKKIPVSKKYKDQVFKLFHTI